MVTLLTDGFNCLGLQALDLKSLEINDFLVELHVIRRDKASISEYLIQGSCVQTVERVHYLIIQTNI